MNLPAANIGKNATDYITSASFNLVPMDRQQFL